MKIRIWIRIILSHICIVCSAALLAVQVLDWFNPFMDFLGHARFLLIILCVSAFFLSVEQGDV